MCSVRRFLFLEAFDFWLAHNRGLNDMIDEFLLHLPFREKGHFLWLVKVCALL